MLYITFDNVGVGRMMPKSILAANPPANYAFIKGYKGDPGAVLYVGPAEMEAAVKAARLEIINQRARFRAAIAQALQDSGCIQHEQYRYLCQQLIEKAKRDAGL